EGGRGAGGEAGGLRGGPSRAEGAAIPGSPPCHLYRSKIRRFWDQIPQNGAQERTRTFTAVKPLAPEASASTNSTTWACRLGHGGGYYGSVTPLSIHA